MKNPFYGVIFCACALVLSGCALSEATVSVPYTVQGAGQSGAGVNISTAIVDARTGDRARISSKMNGYGQELAAIRADRQVTDIVKDAFEAELRSRGYSLASGGATATISVKRFYNSFKTGIFSGDANADVQFAVSVASADGTVRYERDIAVVGIQANIQLMNGSNAAAALSDGLKKVFAAIFSDEKFIAALKEQGTPVAGSNAAPAVGS